jgi:penicillin-binding protein 2
MPKISSLTIKDHFRETHLFQVRAITAAIIGIVLFGIIIARLFYLQIISHDHYTTLSEDNRVNILPIPPIRGLIYDRNGVLLAQNLPSFSLELVPEHIDNLQETLEHLQQLIDISPDELKRFHELRKKKRRFEGIPLRFRLNEVERARIAVNQDRLPGVEVNAELTRHYPQGEVASHIIGYVGRINEQELETLDASRYSATRHIGKVGVERSYEEQLHGEVGFQRVETNAQGRIVNADPEERTLPVPGQHLYLTIDTKVQKVAEQAFADNNGALVAIDPRNGEVIAFVSMPTYDPNLFVNGIDRKTYSELRDSPERPLFNRALQGQYPPGSTIKPLIGLAGLEENLIRPGEALKCPGYYMLKNDERRYRDWKKEGHGQTNLTKAIVESCDVYFYDLSLVLTIDRMEKYLGLFGVGSQTGIDLRGEASGLLPSREWKRRAHRLPWFPGETLITGIGQGFTLTTPLQLAEITATLASNGQRITPRVLHSIRDPLYSELELRDSPQAEKIPIKNPQNWQVIIDAMTEVVHGLRGTARGISHNMPYKMAGKTGTAQVFGIAQDEEYDEEKIAKKLRDHALFIAFAPVDEPRIAVAVIVENGGSGSSAAAPIARQVIDAYLLTGES